MKTGQADSFWPNNECQWEKNNYNILLLKQKQNQWRFRLRHQTWCFAAGPWEECRLLFAPGPPWLAPRHSVTQHNTASLPWIYTLPSLKPEPWWSCDVTCLDPGSPDVQQPGVLVQLQLILLLHVVQLLSGQLRLDERKNFSKSSDNPEGVGGRVFILLISWPFLVCLQNTSLDSFWHQRQTLELCSDAWPLP